MVTPSVKDKTLVQSATVNQRIETEVSKSFPVGAKGMVPFIKDDNSRSAEMGRLLKIGEFIETDAELNDSRSRIVSMATVFNEWKRFSHDTTADQPAIASELTSWSYDAATDTIKCTINSSSHVGFVSLTKYDKYLHEVILSSTDGDSDMIGVVIAFAVDGNGREHTLTAIRTKSSEAHVLAGATAGWVIVYNYNRSDEKVIVDGSFLAGTAGATGWSTVPQGTSVRVKRDGDTIEAWTSQFADSTATIDNNTKLTVNLLSDSVLAVFRGPAAYGYSAFSQPSASFKVVSFSETANVIYDLRTNTAYIYNGSAWVVDATKSLYNDVGVGRFLYNKASEKLYFMESDGPKKIFEAPSSQINFKQNLTSGQVWNYDIVESLGATQALKCDLTKTEVKVFVLDTDAGSDTNGYYVDAGAVAGFGFKEDGKIRVVNQHTDTLSFIIRVIVYRKPL